MTNKENEALKKESSKSKSKSNYNNSGSVDQALDELQKIVKVFGQKSFPDKIAKSYVKGAGVPCGKWSLGKYETMIFLKGNAEYMKRCDTLAQAKIQHKEVKRCVEKYNFDNQYNHYRLVLRGHENDVLIKKEDWNNLLSYLQESKALRSRHSKYTK